MDVPLYALALVAFGILYLVVGMFLIWVLLICLILIFLYLVLRYHPLPDSYPFGASDTMVTAIFVGVTWGIFTLLAPKNPIPLIGSGLTYTSSTAVPYSAIIGITLLLLIGFLLIGAFVIPRLTTGGGSSGGGESGGGTMTVGAR
jgi:glucan phosphoethanolaminetransferase (alkaline phosphatase superfamily)